MENMYIVFAFSLGAQLDKHVSMMARLLKLYEFT